MENLNKNYLEYKLAQLNRKLAKKCTGLDKVFEEYKGDYLSSYFDRLERFHNEIVVCKLVINELTFILDTVNNTKNEDNKKHLLDVLFWCENIRSHEYRLNNMEQYKLLSDAINDIKDSYICYEDTYKYTMEIETKPKEQN